MTNDKKALKSGFWYILANFAVRGMALITTPIFSRILSKPDYGVFNNYTSWTTIAIIIVTMRMESSLISAKFDYKENLDQYNFSVLSLTALITLTWVLIVNLFPAFFTDLMSLNLVYINLLLIYCFFHAVVNFFQVNERYKYKYKTSVLLSLIIAVGGAAFSIFLVWMLQDKLYGRILGSVIPTVTVGLLLTFVIVLKGKKIDFSTWPYVLKISIPYIPHLLSLQILNSVDRIMITRICGASDNAMYSIAYSCGHIVTILLTAMNTAFSPWLGENLRNEKYKAIRKISSYYIAIFSVFALFIMLLAPEILLIMGGYKYLEAKYVLTPVAMGCVCQFLYTLFVNVEQYKKKTVGMAVASVIAAATNYVLNAIFIPKYGYIAAAYTTLIGYLLLLVMHMFLVKQLGYEFVYNYKYIALVVISMLMFTILISFLYQFNYIRYAVIIVFIFVICLIVWKKRSMVQAIIKMILK